MITSKYHHFLSFNKEEIASLFADNYFLNYFQQLSCLIDKTKRYASGLFYELSKITGNCERLDRILPSLLRELMEYLELNSKTICELVNSLKKNKDKLTIELIKDLQKLDTKLNLFEYLVTSFHDKYRIVYHVNEALSKHFVKRELTSLIQKYGIRINNILTDLDDFINEMMDSLACQQFYTQIEKILEYPNYQGIHTFSQLLQLLKNDLSHFNILESKIKSLFSTHDISMGLSVDIKTTNNHIYFYKFNLINENSPKYPDSILNIPSHTNILDYLIDTNYFMFYMMQIHKPHIHEFLKNEIDLNNSDIAYDESSRYNYMVHSLIMEIKKTLSIEIIPDFTKLLIIDLETTGLDTKNDVIVEIACNLLDLKTKTYHTIINCVVHDNRFDLMNNSDLYIYKHSTITKEQILKAIPIEYILPYLQKILSIYPITSFNTSFDLEFLKRIGLSIPYIHNCLMLTTQDILKIPSKHHYSYKYPSLDEAYEFIMKKKRSDSHRALIDVNDATELCLELINNNQYKSYESIHVKLGKDDND